MIVGFTGHRPPRCGGYFLPNSIYSYVCKETERYLKSLRPTKCITGMAQGYDQYAAFVCLRLNIPYIAAIPCDDQDKLWPGPSRKVYNTLLKHAQSVVKVSEGEYSAEKMAKRNRWIVDNSNTILACYDGKAGGTHNCVSYAQDMGQALYIIKPKNGEQYDSE